MKSPCKDCISYAICNVILKRMKNPEITVLSREVDCDVLREYININTNTINYKRIDNVRELFKLQPVNMTDHVYND